MKGRDKTVRFKVVAITLIVSLLLTYSVLVILKIYDLYENSETFSLLLVDVTLFWGGLTLLLWYGSKRKKSATKGPRN